MNVRAWATFASQRLSVDWGIFPDGILPRGKLLSSVQGFGASLERVAWCPPCVPTFYVASRFFLFRSLTPGHVARARAIVSLGASSLHGSIGGANVASACPLPEGCSAGCATASLWQPLAITAGSVRTEACGTSRFAAYAPCQQDGTARHEDEVQFGAKELSEALEMRQVRLLAQSVSRRVL